MLTYIRPFSVYALQTQFDRLLLRYNKPSCYKGLIPITYDRPLLRYNKPSCYKGSKKMLTNVGNIVFHSEYGNPSKRKRAFLNSVARLDDNIIYLCFSQVS